MATTAWIVHACGILLQWLRCKILKIRLHQWQNDDISPSSPLLCLLGCSLHTGRSITWRRHIQREPSLEVVRNCIVEFISTISTCWHSQWKCCTMRCLWICLVSSDMQHCMTASLVIPMLILLSDLWWYQFKGMRIITSINVWPRFCLAQQPRTNRSH